MIYTTSILTNTGFKRVVAELEQLVAEYQQWLDNLPENLSESQLAEHLEQTTEQLTDALDILESVELPRGFGR